MNLTKHPAEVTPKRAIETAGEVFPGGQMIELLAGAPGGEPRLLFWRGKGKAIEPSCLEYKGQQYRPPPIERSISCELVLPSHPGTYGSTRELLHNISKLAKQFAALIESVLFHSSEAFGTDVYVGDLARTAQEIVRRRGEDVEVDPGAIGKRLRMLGFKTEVRDAKGVRLHLSEQVRQQAQRLAHEFGIPEDEERSAGANGEASTAIWRK